MIQANELRIGIVLNIFKYEKVGFHPVVIDKPRCMALLTGEETSYYPIPLTPEILEKCGASIYEENSYSYGSFSIGDLIFEKEGEGYCLYGSEWTIGAPFKYLHQLQNFFYYLCGKELEINLT